MAETQKIFDEWSPAHGVARVCAAAAGLFDRLWNSAQAMAKFFVRNEPEVVDLGPLTTGTTALAADFLKHGFRFQIAGGGAAQEVGIQMPSVQSLLNKGCRIGDVIEFWCIATVGAPSADAHTVTWTANGADALTSYGKVVGGNSYAGAGNTADRMHLHITGANSLTLIAEL